MKGEAGFQGLGRGGGGTQEALVSFLLFFPFMISAASLQVWNYVKIEVWKNKKKQDVSHMHWGASSIWKGPGVFHAQDTSSLKEWALAYETDVLACEGSTAGAFPPRLPNTPSSSLQICGVLGLTEKRGEGESSPSLTCGHRLRDASTGTQDFITNMFPGMNSGAVPVHHLKNLGWEWSED